MGAVNKAWVDKTSNPEGTGPFVTESLSYPRYQLALDASAPQGYSQGFFLAYTSLDTNIARPSHANETGTIMYGEKFITAVETECVTSGTVQFTVTMTLNSPDADTISWAYLKTCTTPVIEIGTTEFGKDVVDQSAAVAAFSNTVVSAETIGFYIYLANGIIVPGASQPFTVIASSSNHSIVKTGLVVYNSTDSSTGADVWVMRDAAHPIGLMEVPFDCLEEGQATITIEMDYHFVTPLTFTFQKSCAAPANYLTSLIIGTTLNTSNIALAGVTQPDWSGAQGYNFDPDSIYHNIFEMHLCNGCNLQQNLPDVPYNITIATAPTGIYDVAVEGSLSDALSQYVDLPIFGTITCKSAGVATTTWSVNLAGYESVVFAFTYTCVYPLIDVGYGSVNSMIVNRSNTLAPWDSGAVTLPATQSESIYYLYLDAANDAGVLPQQYYDVEFTFDTNVMQAPDVDDQGANSAPYVGAAVPLTVTWNCIATASNSPVTMTIRYGWVFTINVKLMKNCIIEEDDGGSPGWSAAGIFFFTLFILCLVLCLAGAGWNYWREEKRGWEIVPLYVTMRNLYDRCRGVNTNWTPQMDTNSRVTNYSNFDDSGSSYQSNL